MKAEDLLPQLWVSGNRVYPPYRVICPRQEGRLIISVEVLALCLQRCGRCSRWEIPTADFVLEWVKGEGIVNSLEDRRLPTSIHDRSC